MTSPAPLTPDTLKFIREASRTTAVEDIATALNWTVEKLERTAQLRLPELRLMDEKTATVVSDRAAEKERNVFEDAMAKLRPMSAEFVRCLRSLQRGTDEYIHINQLMGSLDCTKDAVRRRVKNARIGLARTRFDVIGKPGAKGNGYRFVDRGVR